MSEPFRLRVQKALSAAFEAMHPDDGYSYDMSGRVFRGRAIFGDHDPVPMISILEEAISPESDLAPANAAAGQGEYRLMVQGFVDDDKQNPTDPAHYLLADVKRVLSTLRRDRNTPTGLLGFGEKAPIVGELQFDGGVVRPPDGEVSAKAYFWLRVSLLLVEDHENPFA